MENGGFTLATCRTARVWILTIPGGRIASPATSTPTTRPGFGPWIEIPKNLHGYDLSGARIWFQFQARTAGREAVTEIVY